MARTDAVNSPPGEGPVRFPPWPTLLVGVGLTLLACVVGFVPGQAFLVLRVMLVVAGLVTTGFGVWLGLHAAGLAADERARSAVVAALAALAPLLAFAAMPPEWDALRLLFGVLTAVTLSGAVMLLLPPAGRRVAASLLILLHFGGIFTAVTSVAPPSGDAPWLVNQVWSRFYRYYLQFMYLNNAYHFYSPEPGPPTLLWFHVDYADGSQRWVRIPEREQFHTRQQYQRRLAMTESTNYVGPPLMMFPPDKFQRRMVAGRMIAPPFGEKPPPGPAWPIPGLDTAPVFAQWRLPTPYSRFMVASYAQHVARTRRSPDNPGAAVTGVKVYRVVHTLLAPVQFASEPRLSPTDPTTYQPFYQGEFDADGNLKDRDDPFLYWVIPIEWVRKADLPKGFPEEAIIASQDDPALGAMAKVDFTRIHVLYKTETAPAGAPAGDAPHGDKTR
jgi:hypothetical protein